MSGAHRQVRLPLRHTACMLIDAAMGLVALHVVVLCGSAKKGKAKSKKEKKKRKKKRTRGAISFDVEDLAGTAGKETTSNMTTPLLRLVDVLLHSYCRLHSHSIGWWCGCWRWCWCWDWQR